MEDKPEMIETGNKAKPAFMCLAALCATALFFAARFGYCEEPSGAEGASAGGAAGQQDGGNGKISADMLDTPAGMITDQKVVSFDLSGYTEDGDTKWDIHGESADVSGDVVKVDRISANTYEKEMNTMLTAEKGEFSKKDKNVTLERNVTVITSDGIKLTTDVLEWLSKTNEVVTDSFLVVEKDDMYASGRGARARINAKTVLVKEEIFVKQGELTITCNGPLEINYGENKASFYDDVKVTEPRGQMRADRLDVFFSAETRQIERIVAENNVVLTQDGNTAMGQKAVYTIADGRAILTGSPTITITSDEGLDPFDGAGDSALSQTEKGAAQGQP